LPCEIDAIRIDGEFLSDVGHRAHGHLQPFRRLVQVRVGPVITRRALRQQYEHGKLQLHIFACPEMRADLVSAVQLSHVVTAAAIATVQPKHQRVFPVGVVAERYVQAIR
jgi:hypothetical protein